MGAHSSLPRLQRLTLEGFDPDAMREAVQNATFQHSQVSPGAFRADLLQAQDSKICVDWGRYNIPLIADGAFGADAITLGFVFHEQRYAIFNGEDVAPYSMLVYSEGHELTARLPADCNWVAVSTQRDTLEGLGFELPGTCFTARELKEDTNRLLKSSLLPALQFLLSQADHEKGRSNPATLARALDHIGDTAIAALAESDNIKDRRFPRKGRRPAREGFRLARQAADFIDSELASPLSIATVCAAVGCTYKSLERAFARVYGIAPRHYLSQKRLTRLRALLLDPRNREQDLTSLYLALLHAVVPENPQVRRWQQRYGG